MKRVLVVEDDANERFTLSRVLERVGYEVVSAATGDEAVAALAGGPFHAVVSDVMMPTTDGLSLARTIAERAPGTPIVLVSAFHFGPRQLDRIGIEALHFLDKPIDMDALLRVLASPRQGPNERGSITPIEDVMNPVRPRE